MASFFMICGVPELCAHAGTGRVIIFCSFQLSADRADVILLGKEIRVR